MVNLAGDAEVPQHARTEGGSATVRSVARYAKLDDELFEKVVLNNAYPAGRDHEVWAALLAPELVERTKQTLMACHARNRRATRRKNRTMAELTEQCRGLGAQAQAKLAAAKAEHEDRTRAATNFERMVGDAIAEVNDVCTMRQRGSSATQYRHQLDKALRAISEHKSAAEEAAIVPEAHDHALWNVLHTLGDDHADQGANEPARNTPAAP